MKESWRDIKSYHNSPRPSEGEGSSIRSQWKMRLQAKYLNGGAEDTHTAIRTHLSLQIQHSHNRKGICVHKSSNYIPDYPSAYAITQSVAQKSRFLQVFPNHLYFKIQLPFLSWNLGTYQPSNWIFVVPWWRSRAVFSHRTFTHGRCCNLIRLPPHTATSLMA